MTLTKLYNPHNGPMRVVGFMSGSGTNLEKIIAQERQFVDRKGKSHYVVVAIFSDNPHSRAIEIGQQYNIPVIIHDIKQFYAEQGKPGKEMYLRAEYDSLAIAELAQYQATVALYAGYMSVASKPLVDAFLGINIHPADLSIVNKQGQRMFTGKYAVRKAIMNGQKKLCSTTHLVAEEVDQGKILMISKPVTIEYIVKQEEMAVEDKDIIAEMVLQHQKKLKEQADHIIFPLTVLYLAQGRYAKDEDQNLYFDGRAIPKGVRLKNV